MIRFKRLRTEFMYQKDNIRRVKTGFHSYHMSLHFGSGYISFRLLWKIEVDFQITMCLALYIIRKEY